MQRWELSAFDRKPLALVSVPRPAPGPGEALVAVDAVSLNYRDNLIMANRMGAEPPLPLVPASDMAGVVVDVGSRLNNGRSRHTAGLTRAWCSSRAGRSRPARSCGSECLTATGLVIEREIGNQTLQPGVLVFERAQPPSLVHLEFGVLVGARRSTRSGWSTRVRARWVQRGSARPGTRHSGRRGRR